MTGETGGDCAQCGLPVPSARRAAPPDPSFCCLGCRLAFALARPARPRGEVGVGAGPGETDVAAGSGTLLLRLGAGIFLSMNVMVLSGPFYARAWFGAAAAIPPAYGALERLFSFLLLFLATLALVFLGGPLAADLVAGEPRRAWRPRFDAGTLILLGVVAAYLVSVAHTLRGDGALYYDTAVMILVLVTVGNALEGAARRRAAASAGALLASEAATVWVRRGDGQLDEVDPDRVATGDCVRTRAGEAFAVDGLVVEGAGRVEEAILTGESMPRAVGPGDRVLAGALNLDAPLFVRAEAVGRDRVVRRMERMIDEARRLQAPIQRLADRVASVFVPGVLLLAAASFARSAWRGDPAAGLLDGLSVLLISCPCAFGLAAPLATWVALRRAAAQGILIDSGRTLERLARLERIAFDKTGTLTTATPRLVRIEAGVPEGTDEALRLAAAVDAASLHPIARGLLTAARDRALHVPAPEEVRAFPGLGVEATVEGRRLALGSSRFAASRGVAVPAAEEETALVHLMEGPALLATFHFAERARPDAAPALAALRRLGVEVEILTGDRPGPAARLARTLGVPVTAGLLPEEKVAHLEAARRDASGGGVGMVGDGINDAPVLAAADVGFAIATAADLARRAGGVRLVHDRLDRIPQAVVLARDAMRRVRLNLAWAFGYNAIGLTLAAQGRLTPIFAASTMIVSSLVIIAVSRGAGQGAADGSSPGTAQRTVTQAA